MIKTIVMQYWLEAILGVLVGAIGSWCKWLSKALKAREAEQVAIKSAIKAILHDKLFKICNYYLGLGYIPVEKSEEILDNAKMIYDAYHTLGGNGTGTNIYNKFLKLHIEHRDGEEVTIL